MNASGSKPVRVLVVEDDPGLCELACIWVEAMGFDAVGVESPGEALQMLAGSHFDVLFTDVVMHGDMDGVALAHAAMREHDGLRVVITSGHEPNLPSPSEVPIVLLAKPYRKDDLAEAIERARSFTRPTP